jgi:hypothetical protein
MFYEIHCLLIRDTLDCSEIANSDTKPQAIEKILHKYEVEIRTHLKMEHEFKKLAEDADKRFESLKSEYSNMSLKYNKMLIRLSDLTYANDVTMNENLVLRRQLLEYKSENTDNNKLSSKFKVALATKEKNSLNPRNSSNEFIQSHINKLKKMNSGNTSICIAFNKPENSSLEAVKRHSKNSWLTRQHVEHQQHHQSIEFKRFKIRECKLPGARQTVF